MPFSRPLLCEREETAQLICCRADLEAAQEVNPLVLLLCFFLERELLSRQ